MLSLRQFETLGYGWDSGPGTHDDSESTTKSEDMGVSPSPRPIAFHASMTESAR